MVPGNIEHLGKAARQCAQAPLEQAQRIANISRQNQQVVAVIHGREICDPLLIHLVMYVNVRYRKNSHKGIARQLCILNGCRTGNRPEGTAKAKIIPTESQHGGKRQRARRKMGNGKVNEKDENLCEKSSYGGYYGGSKAVFVICHACVIHASTPPWDLCGRRDGPAGSWPGHRQPATAESKTSA